MASSRQSKPPRDKLAPMRLVLAVAFAFGCGGGGSKQATAAPAPVTCAAAADGMLAMMMRDKEAEGIEDTIEGFKALIRTRCDEDGWTVEARQCLATMQTRTDAERCSTLLTEAQQANLVRDQKAKFGAKPAADGAAPPEPEPTRTRGDPCDGGE